MRYIIRARLYVYARQKPAEFGKGLGYLSPERVALYTAGLERLASGVFLKTQGFCLRRI